MPKDKMLIQRYNKAYTKGCFKHYEIAELLGVQITQLSKWRLREFTQKNYSVQLNKSIDKLDKILKGYENETQN
jgi:uncharacterized protein YjcR